VTTEAGRQATADLIANPLDVKQTAITQAADYGAGLAPSFLASRRGSASTRSFCWCPPSRRVTCLGA
jgi:hypothetical protein